MTTIYDHMKEPRPLSLDAYNETVYLLCNLLVYFFSFSSRHCSDIEGMMSPLLSRNDIANIAPCNRNIVPGRKIVDLYADLIMTEKLVLHYNLQYVNITRRVVSMTKRDGTSLIFKTK